MTGTRGMFRRVGWTFWALVPVAVLAFHFGPGRSLAAREIAATRFREAVVLEREAIEAQGRAYEAHLVVIERRRSVFLNQRDEIEGGEGDERPRAPAKPIKLEQQFRAPKRR